VLTGVFLLGACLGLGVVVFWMMANDTVAPDQPTRGLLAMPHTPPSEPAEAGGASPRAGQGGGAPPPAR
jgi:hypothetical protein